MFSDKLIWFLPFFLTKKVKSHSKNHFFNFAQKQCLYNLNTKRLDVLFKTYSNYGIVGLVNL